MADGDLLMQAQTMAGLMAGLVRQLFLLDDDVMTKLPVAQLRVCGILHGGRRSLSTLARDLGVSTSAMTQIADRLERAHLVKRISENGDRRVKCLELTRRGEQIMGRREAGRVRRAASVLQTLTPSARQEVLNGLQTLTEACAAAAAEGVATTVEGQKVES